MKRTILFCLLISSINDVFGDCVDSATTVSGTLASKEKICSGDLIFEDNFDILDLKKWQHALTMSGGGNNEFQWYTNNRSNSYVENGTLHIKPTLLADEYGEDFLYSGTISINGGSPAEQCTTPNWGCSKTGSPTHIINPIKSARLHTVDSFSFKYGKVEVRAKVPVGDWLWPAIWMMPRYNQYATWPTSGEIDIMESRGNRNFGYSGANIGVEQMGSTLHWGPNPSNNRFRQTLYLKNLAEGYHTAYHRYQLEWTPDYITFSVDDFIIGKAVPPEGGFWEMGQLNSTGMDNPWKRNSKMAPFDQEFFIILNLAIGGTAYFPDDAVNSPGSKPWSNSASNASTQFWKGKEQWLPTWNLNGTDDAHLKIDYVKVWAI